MDIEPYTKEELENVHKMVQALKRIRQELIDEGIPILEYERVFIHGEDPKDVFGTEELPLQSPDRVPLG